MLAEEEIKELWSIWSENIPSRTHYEGCYKRHAGCAIMPLILSLVEAIGLKEEVEFRLVLNRVSSQADWEKKFGSREDWVEKARKRILEKE